MIHALLLPVVEVKDVDGRVKPGMTKFEIVARMQMKRRISIILAAAALLLGGCAQFERNQPVANAADDDSICRANGEPGSPGYVACRKDRDVASSRAAGSDSRMERAHRNLAEDMLNNKR